MRSLLSVYFISSFVKEKSNNMIIIDSHVIIFFFNVVFDGLISTKLMLTKLLSRCLNMQMSSMV